MYHTLDHTFFLAFNKVLSRVGAWREASLCTAFNTRCRCLPLTDLQSSRWAWRTAISALIRGSLVCRGTLIGDSLRGMVVYIWWNGWWQSWKPSVPGPCSALSVPSYYVHLATWSTCLQTHIALPCAALAECSTSTYIWLQYRPDIILLKLSSSRTDQSRMNDFSRFIFPDIANIESWSTWMISV